MNIQSEIEFFSDLGLVDKARFVTRLICEIAEEAKIGNGDGSDALRYKFANEMSQRLARFAYQLLGEDMQRPQDDVVIRMLLGARADKNAQRIMHNAYRRGRARVDNFHSTAMFKSPQ